MAKTIRIEPAEVQRDSLMKVISAKILDATHLELSQPIAAPPGTTIEISIPDEGEDTTLWQDAARDHFLDAYDEQDAIYDDI